MDKKNDIISIWRECFPDDTADWRDMFFSSAYADEWALTMADDEGHTVSSLLLLPYSMTFHGMRSGMAYIYGAGTRRSHRARGHMSRLMCEALRRSAERGDAFTALIPVSDTLRHYYARFGFSTVGFSAPQRFTSVHRFEHSGTYTDCSAHSPMHLYPGFERLMGARECSVQHTLQQFLTVMADVTFSYGYFAAVARPDADPTLPVAMAWARRQPYSPEVTVTELLAQDDDSACAVLHTLQQRLPAPAPMVVMRMPGNSVVGGDFMPGAMVRVVRPDLAFAAVARAHPGLQLCVRLTDRLLPDNTAYYTLADGHCHKTAALPAGVPAPQLEVDAAVLALLLFGSTPIARVIGLPACRPRFTLLMD